MATFIPPPYQPSRLYRGGMLQTLASLRRPVVRAPESQQHIVQLPDGDSIVLHQSGQCDGRVILLFHGLSGCHQSPYMVRLASRFYQAGWTVYRVDARGCGAAREMAVGISHAGRSEDVWAAFDFVGRQHRHARISAAGVSLGGNQLLRMMGRLGEGIEGAADWSDRVGRIAAICPPIDLARCCENMQRRSRRFYNRYFIRALLKGLPRRVREREQFQKAIGQGIPRTLFELDDRLTAPLSGYSGAADYYQQCGAIRVVDSNRWPTLVLAAEDDPIVPATCFDAVNWHQRTQFILTPTGGHAGFIDRDGKCWMDEVVFQWIDRGAQSTAASLDTAPSMTAS
ncbi:alpha/beta fold hydrolase [Stieleria sp. JC731]|uniref:YheT family hydrolase n=1 Tax=Pirellulaceae TaxID=2691357 RepID=UPI001E4071CF|nr:alpha/beta fold hydrolase [Stieleria sp. JC731]MCC9599591.1 alpha/beta fold hydrolase [Stieleria sp. JC731]